MGGYIYNALLYLNTDFTIPIFIIIFTLEEGALDKAHRMHTAINFYISPTTFYNIMIIVTEINYENL